MRRRQSEHGLKQDSALRLRLQRVVGFSPFVTGLFRDLLFVLARRSNGSLIFLQVFVRSELRMYVRLDPPEMTSVEECMVRARICTPPQQAQMHQG